MHEWRERPCKCGYTHEKNPEQFEIYELELVKPSMGYTFPKMKVPRCLTCQTLSILERDPLRPDGP